MRVARLGLAATLFLSLLSAPAHAEEVTPPPSIPPTIPSMELDGKVHTFGLHPELKAQLDTKKVGSVKFWEAVSWCETNHHWNDRGYFSGGLGMAQSVWVGWGGREFAPVPWKATKEEQIIVANRVSFLGYQTKNQYLTLEDRLNNRPYFRPPVRTPRWGKDCVNWKKRRPHRDRYTEAGMAKWKASRGG